MPLGPVVDTEKVPYVKGALERTCKRPRWAIKGVKGVPKAQRRAGTRMCAPNKPMVNNVILKSEQPSQT